MLAVTKEKHGRVQNIFVRLCECDSCGDIHAKRAVRQQHNVGVHRCTGTKALELNVFVGPAVAVVCGDGNRSRVLERANFPTGIVKKDAAFSVHYHIGNVGLIADDLAGWRKG